MKRMATLLALVVLAGLASLPSTAPARANGVPQLVKLSYLDGVSNWGPKDAEGVLQFSFAEAFARVEVKNLKPEAGVTYEGWLVAPDGSALLVGPITPQPSGVGTAETKIDGLARYDYNVFVVAARPASAPGTAMPDQKSIAGRFTVAEDVPAGQGTTVRPSALPETGEPAPGLPWGRIVMTVSTAVGVAIMLFGWRLRTRRMGGAA